MTAALESHPTAGAPFSTVIREASRAQHEEAEGSGFGTALVEGRLRREGYAALMAQTYFVYSALEEVTAAQREDPVGGQFFLPQLFRLPSIERDLDHLIGLDWRGAITPLPSTARYADRIRSVGSSWAGGFVAHHYTRYLGDLSGGQIIRRVLHRAYGLSTDGVRFYIFDEIPKPKPFKDLYRARLDAAPWDDAERMRVVAEVQEAFRLNTALFADLGRDLDRYLVD